METSWVPDCRETCHGGFALISTNLYRFALIKPPFLLKLFHVDTMNDPEQMFLFS